MKEAKGSSRLALLLIDVITDFEFEDGDELLANAMPMARNLSKLKTRAGNTGIPSIYVNDNFGRWQEDFKVIVKEFTKPGAKGREFVKLLEPTTDDFYILKPHRSAFYSTSLMLLLENLKVKKLIVTGLTTDICVLFTANDAYMRGFELIVPEDCVAAVKQSYTDMTLSFMRRVLKADTKPSSKIEFDDK